MTGLPPSASTVLRRFLSFSNLTDADLAVLMENEAPRRTVRAGTLLWQEGEEPSRLALLVDGWAVSNITFDDGARQMLAVHLPGDVIGLSDLALERTAHAQLALTECTIIDMNAAAIGRLFQVSPRLAALLFLISQEERVLMMDRLASMGRTTSLQAVAAFIRQLHARATRGEPSDTFYMPLRQGQVADLLGMSEVHVNRTVQVLRRKGVIRWGQRAMTISNFEQLNELANLPPRTLKHEPDWLPDKQKA